MEIEPTPASETFAGLGLNAPLLQVLDQLGYETPTPIQQHTIPLLLAGRDVIGQAQTGTGKTAAFALPLLQRLDLTLNAVQALILTPTRELAIQVAEAVHTYSKQLGRVKVLPVYGGDSIQKQLARLRGGVHIVVGTPGRLMDHVRRDTLDFSALKTVVLDEADEMLRIGFLEDVEWLLGQMPQQRQTALFSATLPKEVRRIADRYLTNPASAEVAHKTLTVPTVEQRSLHVSEAHKLEALTLLLEAEGAPGEAILIFARTKLRVAELAERLQARGYAVEAMHGDLNQAQRESVLRRLRAGQVEIVIATDVAARGLDVERIARVVNYDIPGDPEAYVHRIGRTARAGRAGQAVLFVTPREERMLREIERYTRQKITRAKLPTRADVAARRLALFKERLLAALERDDLEFYLPLLGEVAAESGRDMAEIAAAAARLAHGDQPLVVPVEPAPEAVPVAEDGMVRLFIAAGRVSGVRPADIVGAIANEAGVPGKAIGAIDIYDDFTFVDVPAEYYAQVLSAMTTTTIRNQPARIRPATERDVRATPARRPYGADQPHGPRAGGKPYVPKNKRPKPPSGKGRRRP
ncbi:MAG: DEAD/DEAH box helicase [Anaerolineales bacterium]|nr:DEAD/DEAH box helicase [Anaerolineales bacterium]